MSRIDLDALEKLADRLRIIANGYIVRADRAACIETESADALDGLISETRKGRKVLTEIAKGEVGPERHAHYLAHRKAVNSARAFLARNGKGEG